MAAIQQKSRVRKTDIQEVIRYLGEDGKVYTVPIGVRVPCHPRPGYSAIRL